MPYLNRGFERLVFIDETSTNTKLTKRTGWSKLGERLVDYVPFGHWKSQTFIAGLRCHSLIAPCVLDHPMNKESFETYVEHVRRRRKLKRLTLRGKILRNGLLQPLPQNLRTTTRLLRIRTLPPLLIIIRIRRSITAS